MLTRRSVAVAAAGLMAGGAVLAVLAVRLFLVPESPREVPPMEYQFGSPCSAEELVNLRGPVAPAADYRLSGPHVHDNLTVFLIHGPETLPDRQFLTLQEALEQGKAVVHETDNVGELAVENRSPGEEIYIHSGDLVKGGKQDRMLHYDLPVAAGDGRVPLASFCVEHGRWSARGGESSGKFDSSSFLVSGKGVKLAAKYRRSQGEVWSNVAAAQERLSRNVGESVANPESASSYQLSLENTRLQESIGAYLGELSNLPEGKDDVIGLAVAINGRMNSAEVYASGSLFRKLWPRLLRAVAVEALAERGGDTAAEPITALAARAFLTETDSGRGSRQLVSDRVHVIMQETEKSLRFDTCDRRADNVVIHRSYLAR